MTTLTDRYVHDVVRRLPTSQRSDVDAELRSTIADMADSVGERDALIALGPPADLASSYRGDRALIGPSLFPDYVRVLRLVLVIAVPALAALSVLGVVTGDDASLAAAVVEMVGGATTAAIQAAFWVTLVFAAIERFGSPDETISPEAWNPDDLPPVPEAPRVGLGDAIAEIVLTVILVVVLFGQHRWSPLEDAQGDPVPVLEPDLWSGPMWAVIALLLAGAGVVLMAHARGSWSWPLAIATTAIDLAMLCLVAWLAAAERLVNPEFLRRLTEEVDRDTLISPSVPLIVVVVGALLVWDAVDALRSAARADRRSVPTGPQLST